MQLVTHQTGPEGRKVKKVLVEAAADIAQELYLGITLDRAIGKPVLMASKFGGMEIEEVAHKDPTAILKGREAMVAEAVGKVTTAIAKAEAELKVQQARIEQVRLHLDDDFVAPARADMEKRQAEARGKAAKIVEDGKATAAVLTQMIETWKAAGPNARDIFLMQKLQSVMSSLVETIQTVSVDRISYLPATAHVTQGIQLVEQVKAAFGVDLAKVVARLGAPTEKTTGG